MPIPQICCSNQNHYKMPFEYVCLNPQCIRNTQELGCIYCCQQIHASHLANIQALKTVLENFQKSIEPTEFKAANMLLQGIQRCKAQNDLRQNLTEIFAYQNGGKRFEKIIDSKNRAQQQEVKQFYERKDKDQVSLQRTIKKSKQKSSQQQPNNFICPVLTFSIEDASEQKYRFVSPFCVANEEQKLVTAFAYPSINRYQDSIEVRIKIQKITPFWLGVGLSFGKKKYQHESKDHIMLTSNGWISNFGKLQQSSVKYCMKDTVKIRVDKKLQIVEFSCNIEKHAIPIELKWNQDIYICCSLYYKDDSVQILAA